MKIVFRVSAETSQDTTRATIDLEDLGMTKEEWSSLSEDKQQTAIQLAFEERVEPPYWVVNNWEQI
jgi:hypothetical protein